jgi:hypothetical protein
MQGKKRAAGWEPFLELVENVCMALAGCFPLRENVMTNGFFFCPVAFGAKKVASNLLKDY